MVRANLQKLLKQLLTIENIYQQQTLQLRGAFLIYKTMSIIKIYRKELNEGVITRSELKEIDAFYRRGHEIPLSVIKLLTHTKKNNKYLNFINEEPSYQKIIINSAKYGAEVCPATTRERKLEYKKEYQIYLNYTKLMIKTRYLETLHASPKRRLITHPISSSEVIVNFIKLIKSIFNPKSIH